MKNNGKLYHYTNIDSLALILKNRTIRLNSLDKMDDLQEKAGLDHQNIGRYFYVSCWTDEVLESIPMWNMYTRVDSGIRIELPQNPFTKNIISGKTLSQLLPGREIEGDFEHLSLFSPEFIIANKVTSPQFLNNDILYKIEYTNNKEFLYPKIINLSNDGINLSYEKIGKYKNIHWSFQREWRYLIMLFPIDSFDNPGSLLHKFKELVKNIANQTDNDPLPSSVDLEISPDNFDKMVITKSPKLSLGNDLILNALLEKYNLNVKIRESTLKGLI